MSSEEFLRENEELMTENDLEQSRDIREMESSQIISQVTGKKTKFKGKGKLKSFGALGMITALIVVFTVALGSGSLVPAAVSEGLMEETDIQYADGVQSKLIAIQQALREGDMPADTTMILAEKGVLVGYIDGNGEFVNDNKGKVSSVLKMNDEIIPADDLARRANSDVTLYNIINESTYGRVAYYFDTEAEKVFKEIGTTRNNYTAKANFDEVVDEILGSGSGVDVNTVSLAAKTRENTAGETEVYYDYEENGAAAKSSAAAAEFIGAVGNKNYAGSTVEATLNSADALKVADTISKEQRSSLFYLAFMENISKMKAGEGNEAKVNDAMNYLYRVAESEVVDVNTGEVVKYTGSALESPSLYAILSGSKMKAELAQNYSSDRILKTIENQLGANSYDTITNTVATASNKASGKVGRFVDEGAAGADIGTLGTVTPTVAGSLVDNSFDTIKGVSAGEFLVEGAINVGNALARRSGAAAGDAAAVLAYSRLNAQVLAMDAAADRMNRSPFDITSKNTFLGSIFHKLAVASTKFTGILGGVKTFSNTISGSVASLVLPKVFADEGEGYMTTFGDCETYATIGAVGTAQCARNGTFDPSTLNDPYNSPEFIQFMEENTTVSASGVRTVNNDSYLANFIKYNDEQKTPLGVVDGAALGNSSSILEMVKALLGATEEEKRIANGAAFVNSADNPDWQVYKHAQRYVSLARAVATLRQFSSDATAYSELEYFEGGVNPVAVFLEEYHKLAGNQ